MLLRSSPFTLYPLPVTKVLSSFAPSAYLSVGRVAQHDLVTSHVPHLVCWRQSCAPHASHTTCALLAFSRTFGSVAESGHSFALGAGAAGE